MSQRKIISQQNYPHPLKYNQKGVLKKYKKALFDLYYRLLFHCTILNVTIKDKYRIQLLFGNNNSFNIKGINTIFFSYWKSMII